MSHNNPSKERGTAWEIAVASYLNSQGHPTVERRAQRGRNDAGDLTGLPGWVIGCKDEQRIDLAAYMDELLAQLANDWRARAAQVTMPTMRERPWPSYGVQVVKRRRKPVSRAYVVMSLEQFAAILKELGT
jgi:hypothetical protein